MANTPPDLSSWLPTFESRNPVVDDWYQSLYTDRSSPLLGQPSSSVPQDLSVSESVGGGSGVSMQDVSDDHAMVFVGGSSDHVNFDALMQPQPTLPDAALRMSHWSQGQTPMMMRSGQPLALETPLPSSLQYLSNNDVQQFLLHEPQAPHSDFQHAMSATLSQSQASIGTRHTIFEMQSLPSFLGPNSHFNSNDQPIASSSHVVSLPVFPGSNRIQSPYPGPSLQWKAPLGTSPLNIEAPSGLPYEFNVGNFLQAPISNSNVNFQPPPRISSPSSTLAQELNVWDAGSDGLLAGSSRHRITDTRRHRPSLLPGRSNMDFTAIEDTIIEKIGHIRRANATYTKHTLKPLKFIQFKPAVPHETPLYTEPVLQSIIVAAAALQDIRICSQNHMSMLIFERGFFLAKGQVTAMADEALDAAIARHSEGNLKRWKTSPDGTSHITKLKGTSKMIWADFEKSADIYVLPVYDLSLNPVHSKKEVTASRITRIETLLTNFTFLDAWLFDIKSGKFKHFLIPFGHGAVMALTEYAIVNLKYFQSVAFGESGWQKRLQNTLAVISTVYHSALLKFKGGPGWIEAGVPDEVQYSLFVQRISSLSEDDQWMFMQLLNGLSQILSP